MSQALSWHAMSWLDVLRQTHTRFQPAALLDSLSVEVPLAIKVPFRSTWREYLRERISRLGNQLATYGSRSWSSALSPAPAATLFPPKARRTACSLPATQANHIEHRHGNAFDHHPQRSPERRLPDSNRAYRVAHSQHSWRCSVLPVLWSVEGH